MTKSSMSPVWPSSGGNPFERLPAYHHHGGGKSWSLSSVICYPDGLQASSVSVTAYYRSGKNNVILESRMRGMFLSRFDCIRLRKAYGATGPASARLTARQVPPLQSLRGDKMMQLERKKTERVL